MNPHQLLAHYDRIADAPDAVARLRRFILDLAVRGKLVPQNPIDEASSDVANQLSATIAPLRVNPSPQGNFLVDRIQLASAFPFELPDSWHWARLSDVATRLTDGTHHSPPNGPSGEYKYITAKNIKEEGISLHDVTYVSRHVHEEIYARCNPEPGDILYVKDGATTGVVTINNLDEPFSMLSSVALIKLSNELFNRLVVLFLRSPFFYQQMRGFMKGAAIPRVTLKRMAPALIPVPPLAEQHRIVTKVDELMALCDELEAARAKREATRDRLAAASLARLNAPDPETFQTDARFALDALPALTTRPDQIKQLRQTILNLAVRGKLVPQNPDDESALSWIRQRGDESLKIRRSNTSSPTDSIYTVFATDYSLPNSWQWTKLGCLVSKMDAGWSPQCENHPRSDSKKWGVLKTTSVQSLSFDCHQHKELPAKLKPRAEYEAKVGDILVTRAGPKNRVGVSCVVDSTEPRLMISDKLIRIRLIEDLSPGFFALALNAGVTLEAVEAAKSGMAVMQMNISQDKLKSIPVPLPPIAEQHRIVAKVDELMSVCDQLEASLVSGDATRRRLLDALLTEALAPAGDAAT